MKQPYQLIFVQFFTNNIIKKHVTHTLSFVLLFANYKLVIFIQIKTSIINIAIKS